MLNTLVLRRARCCFFALACTSIEEETGASLPPAEEEHATGGLLFTFSMDVDYMEVMNEPAEGAFYASLYLGG